MMTSTALIFSFDASAGTRPVRGRPNSTSSAAAFGALVLFLGTAPLALSNTAPTAQRPSLPAVEATAERRNGYRRPLAIERGLARLKMFSQYKDDWDCAGAVGAIEETVNAAVQYLTILEPWHPAPLSTLDRSGEAILEFEDQAAGFFGSIRFLPSNEVELYSKHAGHPSDFSRGHILSLEVSTFLVEKMKLPTFS